MPYIKSDDGRREALRDGDSALLAGELNYQIFYYVKNHWNLDEIDKQNIKVYVENFLGTKRNYQKYNDMTGALIRCYVEIKRRLDIDAVALIEICESYDQEIADYEDIKIRENGDVEDSGDVED